MHLATSDRDNPFRPLFPSLQQSTVFLDNAGGSQMPKVVADAMYRYVTMDFVQTGADYDVSRRASATVKTAHEVMRAFMGVDSSRSGEVIIGPSTSQLCRMLADCYGEVLTPGDEVIVCDTAHESNFGPWLRLEKNGVVLKRWRVDADTASRDGKASGVGGSHRMEDFERLLSPRTRIVAFPHVSNILGEIVDVERITGLAHGVGARVVVDGVAFAPHRSIDVKAWNVDWYVFSSYKVFGPHAGVLYGRADALAELTGPNHFFISRTDVPRKFELGGTNHESCAAIAALPHYLELACNAAGLDTPVRARETLYKRAFAEFERVETRLQEQLVAWLLKEPRVRIIGPPHAGPSRVCTISFVSTRGVSSRAIAAHCNAQGFGVRYGDFYAYRLCEALGLLPSDGVVRVSLAHYNTHEEIERLIACLAQVI